MKQDLILKESRLSLLAEEVLELVKSSVTVNYHFISTALGGFRYVNDNQLKGIGTNGRELYYNSFYVLACYKRSGKALTLDFLHMVLHCLLHHPFVHSLVIPKYWELAADIMVEKLLNEFADTSGEPEYRERMEMIVALQHAVKILTAERIYEYFLTLDPGEINVEEMSRSFSRDCHEYWYRRIKEREEETGEEGSESPAFSDRKAKDKSKSSREQYRDASTEQSAQAERQEEETQRLNRSKGLVQNEEGSRRDSGSDQKRKEWEDKAKEGPEEQEQGGEGLMEEMPEHVQDTDRKENSDRREEGAFLSPEELEKQWKKAGRQVQLMLETFSKKSGNETEGLLSCLKGINREKKDYSALLRRFFVLGEALRINDEEFDYLYYTYGLKLYRDMPLIEPLEYKEIKAVREFVIAIDTSGSCSGELVKEFIKKTWSILKQQESFFHKINIHILQCDEKVRADVKITCEAELNQYMKEIILFGFGGTDFRPVFAYVEELRRKKELLNLKGLVYLTDGLGIFPDKKPGYETIFAFAKAPEEEVKVPGWAVPVLLTDIGLKAGAADSLIREG